MQSSGAHNVNNSIRSYYASHRASAILNQNKNREIGKVFAEYKDKLVIISGETKKEHAYLIPKTKVHHYGDKKVYFIISENSLEEFEI
jgi:hypothetical protein